MTKQEETVKSLSQEQVKNLIVRNAYFQEVMDLQNEAVFRHQLIQSIDRNTQSINNLTSQILKVTAGASSEEETEQSQNTEVKSKQTVKKKELEDLPDDDDDDEEETKEDDEEADDDEEEGYEYVPKKVYNKGK